MIMIQMKNIAPLATAFAVLLLMNSCASGAFALASGASTSYVDDLYATHDRVAIAKAEKAAAEAEAAAARAKEEKIHRELWLHRRYCNLHRRHWCIYALRELW